MHEPFSAASRFVGIPLLTCQRELRVLHQRDLLLKPDDQFVSTLDFGVSSR
jgi:hypothetical protein